MKWIYNLENDNVTLAIDSIESELSVPYNNENFIKPKINLETFELYESATPQETIEIESQKKSHSINLINLYYVKLYKSALERTTKKTGSLEYLEIQRAEYNTKYITAIQVLNNQDITNQWMYRQLSNEKEFEDFSGNNLQDALNNYGLISLNDRMKDFCQIVKFVYEYSENIFNNFLKKITYMRTRLQTDIEINNTENYHKRIKIVEYVLSNTLTEIQINNLFSIFVNIEQYNNGNIDEIINIV